MQPVILLRFPSSRSWSEGTTRMGTSIGSPFLSLFPFPPIHLPNGCIDTEVGVSWRPAEARRPGPVSNLRPRPLGGRGRSSITLAPCCAHSLLCLSLSLTVLAGRGQLGADSARVLEFARVVQNGIQYMYQNSELLFGRAVS